MSDKVFFDTNVLLYTIGQHDARTPTAEALLSRGGLISVQVLNELASVAHRKLRMSWPEVTEALGAIRILCPSPLPITAEVHEAALRLAGQHSFHIYDALIVAAALEADCATLYTEDLQSGQVIDGRLTIHNPFNAPPPENPELWRAYEATVFLATVDGVVLRIRPGHGDSDVDRVLARRGLRTWAFITAWNPGSELLLREENEARQTRLEEEVRSAGFETFNGVGEPLDSEWTPEHSLLILGISQADAIALGHKHGQVAIVVGQFQEPATLVRCHPTN